MRDSEIVAAIVAGDPQGLAAAYDRYAAALHSYCRSLLAESADAADAVQDTFVSAASRLAGLREPDRLRPWLYAVARNECYRRLRARHRTTGLDEAGEITDTSADTSADAARGASRGELRELVRAPSPSFRAKLILVAFSQVRACAGGLSAYDLTAGRPALESEDLV